MALAKVRALHPDIFSDDDVSEVSIPGRWLFAGLWCYSCDNGHLADKSKQIKRWIYATDDVNVADLLRELEQNDLITRSDGWITIPGLPKRQRVDWRYFKTCLKPGCVKPDRNNGPDSQPETRRGHDGHTTGHAGATRGHVTDGDGDGVSDGDGDGETPPPPLVATPSGKRAPARATKRGDWKPNEKHLQIANEVGVNPGDELAAFHDYVDSVGKTYKDWDAAFRGWLRRAKTFKRPTVRSNTQSIDWDAAMQRARERDAQAEGPAIEGTQ